MNKQTHFEAPRFGGGSLRNKITGLLAMAPFVLACQKKAEKTPEATASATPTPAASSAKPAMAKVPGVKSADQPKVVKLPPKPTRDPNAPMISVDLSSGIGPTLFMGDSNTKKLGEYGGPLDMKDAKVVAEEQKDSAWLLAEAKRLAEKGELPYYDNAVVLIGSNDVGKTRPPQLFQNITHIYQTLHGDTDYDGEKDVEGVGRVYGVTIPPFQGDNGFCRYSKIHPKPAEPDAGAGGKEGEDAEDDDCPNRELFDKINERRLIVNELIRKSKHIYRVFDLAAPLKDGGIADDENPNRLSPIGPDGLEAPSPDGIHFKKRWLKFIYERELKRDIS